MFVDSATAHRIERAEAAVTRVMATALITTPDAPEAFARDLAGGVAAYVRPGSPMNKVIGAGLDQPLADDALAAIEAAYRDRSEPVRIELATMAAPATGEQLTARGYRLVGFENVLVRALAELPAVAAAGVRVDGVTRATLPVFRDVVVDGFAAADATGVVVDEFSRSVIAAALDDSLHAPGVHRYLAYRDDAPAAGASMYLHDRVAILTGSATLPAHRRRGIQAALLTVRLADARAAGADLAIITTGPGTQSQANVMKLGFALAYARAVLIR